MKCSWTIQRKRAWAVEILSLNRFQRRIIAESFFEFASTNRRKGQSFIARRYAVFNNTVYLFIIVHPNTETEFLEGLSNLAISAHLIYDNYKPKKVVLLGERDLCNVSFSLFSYMLDHTPRILASS